MTFSKSLAQFLAKVDPSYKVERFEISIGRELQPKELSKTGIYLLVSKDGVKLRAQLSGELSDMYRDGFSRFIYEAKLKRIG